MNEVMLANVTSIFTFLNLAESALGVVIYLLNNLDDMDLFSTYGSLLRREIPMTWGTTTDSLSP